MAVRLTGVDVVLRNLNREIKGIRFRTHRGIKTACLLVKRRAQQKTPVLTGNLKGSAYVEVYTLPVTGELVGEIGYTAFYAPYVHERPKLNPMIRRKINGKWQLVRQLGQSKFLQAALHESVKDIVRIIIEDGRLKK